MKIRNSFVTNSSSSSFVVAIKKGIKKENLVEDLLDIYSKNKCLFDSAIDEYVRELNDTPVKYLSTDELEIIEKAKSDNVTFINSFLYMIVDWLIDETNSELDSWRIGVAECSNEDEGISSLLYDLGYVIKGEYIKLLS